MNTLTGILGIILIIWFWLDSARSRELAIAICAQACTQRDVQFLDQTVVLRRLGLNWTNHGIRVRRTYRFDFSEEGLARHSGHIVMVGIQLQEFSLGLPSTDTSDTGPH
jgi:hypothetical protein